MANRRLQLFGFGVLPSLEGVIQSLQHMTEDMREKTLVEEFTKMKIHQLMKEGARRANGICEGKLPRTVFTGHERKLPIPASIPQLEAEWAGTNTNGKLDGSRCDRSLD